MREEGIKELQKLGWELVEHNDKICNILLKKRFSLSTGCLIIDYSLECYFSYCLKDGKKNYCPMWKDELEAIMKILG